MVNAAGTGRAIVQCARLLPRQFNHVFHAGNRQADIGGPDQGAGGHQAHRRKATQGVVTGCGQGGRHRGERRGHQEKGVAVRGLLGHMLGANGTRGTRPVVHHKAAAQDLAQLEGHQTAHRIGAGTRRKRHHNAHRSLGIGSRVLRLRAELGHQQQRCGQAQQVAAREVLKNHGRPQKIGWDDLELCCTGRQHP